MAPHYRRAAVLVILCCSALSNTTIVNASPSEAMDIDGSKKLFAVASQLEVDHEDIKARDAYVHAIASLDDLDRNQDKEVAILQSVVYFGLASLDERLNRIKDAEVEYGKAVAASLRHDDSSRRGPLFPSLQRQQALYMRDGDFALAVNAATTELNLYALIDKQRGFPFVSLELKFSPTFTIARSYAAMGKLEEAKKTYDTAWDLAEYSVLPPETMYALYTGSVAVYSNLHLTDQIAGLEKRLRHINDERAAGRAISTTNPNTIPAKPAVVVSSNASESKAGFKDWALQRCKPNYPREALIKEQEGTVVMHFKVSSASVLLAATITKTSGFEQLDQAAMNALSKCEFKSAMSQRKPVDGEFNAAYVWKLPD